MNALILTQSYMTKYASWSPLQCSKKASSLHRYCKLLHTSQKSESNKSCDYLLYFTSCGKLQIMCHKWKYLLPSPGKLAYKASAGQRRKASFSPENSKERSMLAASENEFLLPSALQHTFRACTNRSQVDRWLYCGASTPEPNAHICDRKGITLQHKHSNFVRRVSVAHYCIAMLSSSAYWEQKHCTKTKATGKTRGMVPQRDWGAGTLIIENKKDLMQIEEENWCRTVNGEQNWHQCDRLTELQRHTNICSYCTLKKMLFQDCTVTRKDNLDKLADMTQPENSIKIYLKRIAVYR